MRPYRVWLDEDGRHIWFSHKCVNGDETTWLSSTWKVGERGQISPSIVCNLCGFHEIVSVTEEYPKTSPEEPKRGNR